MLATTVRPPGAGLGGLFGKIDYTRAKHRGKRRYLWT